MNEHQAAEAFKLRFPHERSRWLDAHQLKSYFSRLARARKQGMLKAGIERAKTAAEQDTSARDVSEGAEMNEEVQDDEFPSHDASGRTTQQVLHQAPSHPSQPKARDVAYLGKFLGVDDFDLDVDVGHLDSYESEDEMGRELEPSDLDESDESESDQSDGSDLDYDADE